MIGQIISKICNVSFPRQKSLLNRQAFAVVLMLSLFFVLIVSQTLISQETKDSGMANPSNGGSASNATGKGTQIQEKNKNKMVAPKVIKPSNQSNLGESSKSNTEKPKVIMKLYGVPKRIRDDQKIIESLKKENKEKSDRQLIMVSICVFILFAAIIMSFLQRRNSPYSKKQFNIKDQKTNIDNIPIPNKLSNEQLRIFNSSLSRLNNKINEHRKWMIIPTKKNKSKIDNMLFEIQKMRNILLEIDKQVKEIWKEQNNNPGSSDSVNISEPPLPTDEIEQLCNLYNSAIIDSGNEREFYDKYNKYKLEEIGFVKTPRGSATPSTFEETGRAGSKNYLLIDLGNKGHVVVPIFRLEFNSTKYETIKEIFECQNYKPGLKYSGVDKLIEPACFEFVKNNWRLKKRGKLILKGESISPLPPPPLPSQGPLDILLELYNSAADSGNNTKFFNKYNPKRFGVVNAMDRKSDISIPAVFSETSDGDYFLFNFDNRYAVVPRHNLDFNSTVHELGAMKDVFECSGFNPDMTYRKVKLIEPAYFEQEIGGNNWKLRTKGKLDLGKGDS